ncbi:MAG TPA: hypothetical protein VL793_07840, partial [Patescibacteria group bacterium]|nr:hypothetical protein [Patescibacteria group bacterium]
LDVPAQSCRIIAVRTAEDHPLLVSTSRHVTQGMIDVHEETWSLAKKTLTGTSQLVANDDYELRVAGLSNGGRRWKFVSAELSNLDRATGVSIAPSSAGADEEGWLRLTIHSPADRTVRWALKFSSE